MKKIILGILIFFISINCMALEISSTNYALYNMNENKEIFSLDSNKKISIASLTKIMTVIVAIENIDDFDQKITITKDDFKNLYEEDAATAGLYVGEELTYNDLLYCTLLASGAECSQSLANNISGNISSFVELMNNKAKELNMSNTHYQNVIGLDNNDHYSSINDVAIILKYALKNEKFKEIFQTKKYTLSDNYLDIISTFWYTSYKYDYNMDFIIGAKTGYTDDAGKCLASLGFDSINDIYYMLVTCGADISTKDAYHIKDAYSIYNYYFENYKYQTLIQKGDLLVTLKTKYSNIKEISFYANEDITYYLKNDYDKELIKIKYDGLDTITYKNKKGDIIGKVSIYYDNDLVNEINIILNDEYKFSLIRFIIDTKIIYGIFIFILVIVILLFKKKKK